MQSSINIKKKKIPISATFGVNLLLKVETLENFQILQVGSIGNFWIPFEIERTPTHCR